MQGILHSTLFFTQGEVQAEKILWAMVIVQAIQDLKSPRRGPIAEAHRQTARDWFYKNKSREPKSFHWVCRMLGLSKSYVLRKVEDFELSASSVSAKAGWAKRSQNMITRRAA